MKSPSTITELRELRATGASLSYRFFLDYQPPSSGAITDACFSQWWPCLFKVLGEYFTSSEHYMMHQKALLFGDQTTAAHILETDHPFIAKTLGRSVHGFDQTKWEQERFGIVVRGNLAKFQQNPALLARLLSTGDDILAEASPVDTIWGTGCAADAPAAANPALWPGQNLLGFALMAVRDSLRESSAIALASSARAS
jgi:ribA/ribD-fused uncharacterized protein